jgi:hypothetical protein
MQNLKLNKILWFVISSLVLIVATVGLVVKNLYVGLVRYDFIPTTFAQDILTIFLVFGLLYLIYTTKKSDIKKQLVIIGIISSFCYLYAIFSIEQVYNSLYLAYLAIFSLSFFSVIISINSLSLVMSQKWVISKIIKNTSIGFSILVALLFSSLWISALIPLMTSRNQVQYLYSIYILDLCFVMPSFVIVAYLSFKNNSFGLLISPVMYILGIFVIFPLGLGELAKPYFGQQVDTISMIMSFTLSLVFLILGYLQIRSLKPVLNTTN